MKQKELIENTCDVYDIRFGDKSFRYYLYNSPLERCIENLYNLNDVDTVVIICDENVGSLYGQSIVNQLQQKYKCSLITFKCTEKNKNLKVLEELTEKVLLSKATRRTCIVGLGGGICGNMSGMIAALLFRGVKFVHIPTSLMAILDSVLSLKQAINSHLGKNLIGVYYTPEMVITNIGFLDTLPESEIISGLCEVIKNALTILPDSMEKLLEILNPECNYSPSDYRYFIDMSIKAKTLVMKNDPFEKGDALVLEYGHTIGHAIELAAEGRISHGEAVGLGMLCAAEISYMLGYLSESDVRLHKMLLDKAGASTKLIDGINPDTILSIMKYDNKRGYINSQNGAVDMVLLDSIGKPLINGGKLITAVPDTVVRQAIMKVYT
jgi:3-dehydroquinate synthetase